MKLSDEEKWIIPLSFIAAVSTQKDFQAIYLWICNFVISETESYITYNRDESRKLQCNLGQGSYAADG